MWPCTLVRIGQILRLGRLSTQRHGRQEQNRRQKVPPAHLWGESAQRVAHFQQLRHLFQPRRCRTSARIGLLGLRKTTRTCKESYHGNPRDRIQTLPPCFAASSWLCEFCKGGEFTLPDSNPGFFSSLYSAPFAFPRPAQNLTRIIHDFRSTKGLAMVQIRCLGRFETKSEAFLDRTYHNRLSAFSRYF